MKPVSKKEFRIAARKNKYLKRRWSYSKKAINFVMKEKCKSCLEIGPAFLPLFHDSHLMDIRQHCSRKIDFIHNCCDTPWPMKDKQYDVVVALQVWEHLPDKVKSFNEVKRVARSAVLSLPYKWGRKSRASPQHWGIDEEVILKWTGLEPVSTKLVPSRKLPDKKKVWNNILCFYKIP